MAHVIKMDDGVMIGTAGGSVIIPTAQILVTVEEMLSVYLEQTGQKFRLKMGIEKIEKVN